MKIIILLAIASLCALPAAAGAPWILEVEAAMTDVRSNDVAIPGDTGTRFSLTDDLATDDDVAFRVELGLRLGDRNELAVLYAPLRLHADGSVDRPIDFDGHTFPAESDLAAVYQFNSYRLRWTYDLVHGDRFRLGLGVTGKVREAYIELSDDADTARYDDLGFVPLLNLRLDWRFGSKLGLVIAADGAAAPGGQGRAADVLAALTVHPWDKGTFRLGYRFLEGGVDIDEVYNMALINYYVFGWSQHF